MRATSANATVHSAGTSVTRRLSLTLVVLGLLVLTATGSTGAGAALTDASVPITTHAHGLHGPQSIDTQTAAHPNVEAAYTNHTPGAGPEAATKAKRNATKLLAELRALNNTHPSLVATGVLNSVEDTIALGDRYYDLGRWTKAAQAYKNASQTARGALRTYYHQAAEDDLKVVQSNIEAYSKQEPGRAQNLSNQLDHIESDLGNATTLTELRRIHHRAHSLAAQSRSLKPTLLDRIIAAVPFSVAFVAALALGLAAYFRWQQITQRNVVPQEATTEEDTPTRPYTPDKLNDDTNDD